MREHAAVAPKSKPKSKEQRELKTKRNEWRITKMVLAIFLSFLICYLPITIVKVADNEVRFPGTQRSYQTCHVLMCVCVRVCVCVCAYVCLSFMWQAGRNLSNDVQATFSIPLLLFMYQTTRRHFQNKKVIIHYLLLT